MPEYLPVIVIAVALPLVTAITYLAAYLRPEPGPRRDEALR